MKKKILVIIGTRPEALKLFPVVYKLNEQDNLQTIVCVTAQHRDLLDPISGTDEDQARFRSRRDEG